MVIVLDSNLHQFCCPDSGTSLHGSIAFCLESWCLVSTTATGADLPFDRMLRIRKISGHELPALSTEKIRDIHDLKRELFNLYGFPICLQQLLHKGTRLDNTTKIDVLQDANSLDDSSQPDALDASIHLQLVLATASTAAQLKETNELFRVACQHGDLETAQLLLQAGAVKDVRDRWGRTALMEAACNNTEIVQFLLQAGAVKDVQDWYGRTALMAAARNGCTQIAQLPLQAGADEDLQDQSGKTALMEAARNGHAQIVRLLLQAGAEKDLQDHWYGRTALMEAARNGHTEIVQLLLR